MNFRPRSAIRPYGKFILATGALLTMQLLTAPKIHAQDFSGWDPIFQGIDFETGSGDSSDFYAIRIDLTAPGISFETTPTSSLAASQGFETESQTTSDFLTSTGAQVAINGNFFSNVSSTVQPEDLTGLAISNGQVVSGADGNYQSLLINALNGASIGDIATGGSTAGIQNAISGVQNLVNGVAVVPNTTSGDPTGVDPRTDVGVSQNGQYLYLLAVDGRSAQSVGITDQQAGQILLDLGAYNGVNVDGGGSTALVQDNGTGGAAVLNKPSGGTERLDGNNFGVFANALPSTPPGNPGGGTTPTGTPYTNAVMADHPIAYYQLNEAAGSTTIVDSSGNGHNGTDAKSGVTPGQANTPLAGQAGTTTQFSGATGAHATVPYSAALNPGSFTIAAWADPTSASNAFQAVVSNRDDKGSGANGNSGFILYDGPATGSSSNVWQFWLGGNKTQTYNFEGRNTAGFGLGPVVALNTWSFVVGTFSANGGPDATGRYTGTEDLYVNGVLELSLNNIQYLPNAVTNLYIGAGGNEAANDTFDFAGDISQVSLFGSALNTDQIDALYQAGVTAPEPGIAWLLGAGLVSLYGWNRWNKRLA